MENILNAYNTGWYGTSSNRGGYDTRRGPMQIPLLDYFDAFLPQRAALNAQRLEAYYASMSPEVLNSQISDLRASIADLQSRKARIRQEGLASVGDILHGYDRNRAMERVAETRAGGEVEAANVERRARLEQEAMRQRGRMPRRTDVQNSTNTDIDTLSQPTGPGQTTPYGGTNGWKDQIEAAMTQNKTQRTEPLGDYIALQY